MTKAALDCGLEAVEIAKTLDSALVAGKAEARSKRDKRETEKAGHSLQLDDVEPWDEPVEGVRLLNGLVADLRRYVVTGDHEVDAIALWVLHTYAHSIALVSPRLGITSPTPGCGKTTLLDWLAGVTPRSLEAVNVSPAAVYRVIEKVRPTLLIDEADSFLARQRRAAWCSQQRSPPRWPCHPHCRRRLRAAGVLDLFAMRHCVDRTVAGDLARPCNSRPADPAAAQREASCGSSAPRATWRGNAAAG